MQRSNVSGHVHEDLSQQSPINHIQLGWYCQQVTQPSRETSLIFPYNCMYAIIIIICMLINIIVCIV